MLSKVSIKRPVSTMMVLFIVVLCGIVGLSSLSLDLMPNVSIPLAVVQTTYVGAGPEEIETLVTKPVEEALGTVSKVDSITSTSSSNSSMVIVQFVDGTDVDMAAIDMREKIDMMKSSLPDGANDPMVIKMDVSAMSAIYIGAHGDMDIADLTTVLKNEIVNRLERIDGVASVTLTGNVENEVQIILNPERMQGYKVTTQQVSGLLQAENLNLPAGQIKQGDTNLQLRSVGQFQSIEEISDLPLTTPTGALIHLRDIAEVKMTQKDESAYALIDGQPAVQLTIQKQSNANIVDVSEKIDKELAKIAVEYPDISMLTLSNTADYIKTSVGNVLITAVEAALMAMVVLFLFLRSAKSSLIIGVSIPTSVVATFALMYVSEMTLNIISLGGITIGIGMLVDNSVVVLENITRHFEELGEDAKTAARDGSTEVSMAIAASTLTTVAVFLPLMFVKGTFGQMFRDLSLTVTFALLCSLVVSLTFVPMAASRFLKRETGEKKNTLLRRFLALWGKGLDAIDHFYGTILRWCLNHKKVTLALVLLFFIGTMSLVPVIGMDLMPVMDQGSASVMVEMPKGAILEETSKMTDTVLSKITDIPEIKEWYMTAGGSSTDSASITFNFVDKQSRKRSTDEIADDMRNRLEGIPGAKITVSSSNSAMGSFGSSSDVEFQLTGDETEQLRNIAADLEARLLQEPWVDDMTNSLSDPVPEANITINRARASMHGITSSSIASAVSTAVTGTTPTQFKVSGDELDIRVMQDKDRTEYLNDLRNITVVSASGAEIPLTEVADIEVKDGADQITRSNQQRYITVGANLAEGVDARTAQTNLERILNAYAFPNGYDYKFTGTLESMMETFTSLFTVLIVAVLLVYMIMAAQFESFLYPFIIMFSLPIALTGGVLGLFVTGNTITATSFMGFIMLVGMVVNNAIVLVDYTNQLREKGMECNAALAEAGPTRLRPILMTTLTTVIGMLPMALTNTEGTEMQQPMAICIIFGMMISTLVTLVFVPVVYSSFEKLRRVRKKYRLAHQQG